MPTRPPYPPESKSTQVIVAVSADGFQECLPVTSVACLKVFDRYRVSDVRAHPYVLNRLAIRAPDSRCHLIHSASTSRSESHSRIRSGGDMATTTLTVRAG